MFLIAFILALINSHFFIFFKVINEKNEFENVKNISLIDNNSVSIVFGPNMITYNKSQPKFIHLDIKKKQLGLEQENGSTKVNSISGKVCMPEKNTKYFEFFVSYWSYIDILVYSVIPFSSMFIGTVIIFVKVNFVKLLKNMNNQFL
jgi:hypothetical protein